MHLESNRANLITAFQAVGAAIPARTPKEILKSVKLQVSDGKAILMGTDLEVGIRYELLDVQILQPGVALLPAARILAVLRELTDDKVRLEITGDMIWIRSGYSEFQIPAQDPADYPPVQAFQDEQYFVIPANQLQQLIRRTIFATDVESTRYTLGGVLFEFSPERITLVATDSRRLAHTYSGCTVVGNPQPANQLPILPMKSLALLEKCLGVEGDVQIAVHANDIFFKVGSIAISSQLIQGRFPDYKRVIPVSCKHNIELVVAPFVSAIRQSQVTTDQESRGVNFVMHQGVMRLSSRANDIGQSKIELPIPYDGEEISITFDARFILDFLKVLDAGSTVVWKLNENTAASLLQAGENYQYVIMPLAK